MFSSSQFNATNAFSSGGFMASQSTQFGDSTPSPAKGFGQVGVSSLISVYVCYLLIFVSILLQLLFQRRETHGLVPVTVKQISEAHQSGDEKSNFVINGVDVANVSVVGMVFDKAERNTDVGFTGDDGTGRIKCRRWVNENFDSRNAGNRFFEQVSIDGLKSYDQLLLDYLQQPQAWKLSGLSRRKAY